MTRKGKAKEEIWLKSIIFIKEIEELFVTLQNRKLISYRTENFKGVLLARTMFEEHLTTQLVKYFAIGAG